MGNPNAAESLTSTPDNTGGETPIAIGLAEILNIKESRTISLFQNQRIVDGLPVEQTRNMRKYVCVLIFFADEKNSNYAKNYRIKIQNATGIEPNIVSVQDAGIKTLGGNPYCHNFKCFALPLDPKDLRGSHQKIVDGLKTIFPEIQL